MSTENENGPEVKPEEQENIPPVVDSTESKGDESELNDKGDVHANEPPIVEVWRKKEFEETPRSYSTIVTVQQVSNNMAKEEEKNGCAIRLKPEKDDFFKDPLSLGMSIIHPDVAKYFVDGKKVKVTFELID